MKIYNVMILSIIIPAKNEEKYLPRLLRSIKTQNFFHSEYEIIVADNKSKDKTRDIAEKYHCKIVLGGFPGRARNMGAQKAKGEILMFVDADMNITDRNFIKKAINEFNRGKLDVAAPRFFMKGNKADALISDLWNQIVGISQYVSPVAGGGCLFVRKEIHDRIKGFNEEIMLGEDSDYVKRAAKIGRFRMIKNLEIEVSPRRFKKEGYIKTLLQDAGIGFYWLVFGKPRKNKFDYKFDIYEDKNQNSKTKSQIYKSKTEK